MPEGNSYKHEDKLLLLKMRENSSEAFNALYEKYWEPNASNS